MTLEPEDIEQIREAQRRDEDAPTVKEYVQMMDDERREGEWCSTCQGLPAKSRFPLSQKENQYLNTQQEPDHRRDLEIVEVVFVIDRS